ncbi:MAG TPA: aminomethyltransferase beta-barrel domain-containing protein, partial [Candidatus Paceibacterota bacterium]|nr:aminomethyltransferase beta-barrel domain-containing protein [Candidatus Paceibacterota bacterium]
KDIERNILTVSDDPTAYAAAHQLENVCLEKENWISGERPDPGRAYKARVRYHQEPQACTISYADKTTVRFNAPQAALAAGQSLVLYDGEICLGGGIIS